MQHEVPPGGVAEREGHGNAPCGDERQGRDVEAIADCSLSYVLVSQ